MTRLYANNFSTTLNGAITDVATSMTLTSVTGFPAVGSGDTAQVTLTDGSNVEVVTATAIAGSVITITRAQEGTSGFAFADLDTVEIRVTALSHTDVLAADLTPVLAGPLDASGTYIGFGGSSTSTAYCINHAGNIPKLIGAANYYWGFTTSSNIYAQAGTSFNSITFTNDSSRLVIKTNNSERMSVNDSGTLLGGSGARVTTILDEDAMGTDSATALATQQSIKAYVDDVGGAFKGFRAGRSTTQTITTSTNTKMQLNVEVYDTEGDYDPTTNYRHTPSLAGKWLYIAETSLSSLGDGKSLKAIVYKNGSADTESRTNVGSSTNIFQQVSTVIDMNGSTDYAECYIWHDHGSNRDTQGAASVNWFIGIYLGT